MLAFCEAVGCQTSLRIVESYPFDNPKFEWRWDHERESHHSSSRDWDIEFIEEAIDTKNETLLRGLWGVVVSAKPKVLQAHYTRNNTAGRHVFPSKAAQKLSTLAWVLDRDGNLRTPKASDEAELADGLAMPANRALLEELAFGRDAGIDKFAKNLRESSARSHGFASDEAAQAFKMKYGDMSEEEQLKAFARPDHEQRASAFEGDPSANPDQRAALAGIDGATADETRYEMRERSVVRRSPGQIDRGKEYLRQHCSNADGHVICQVCLLSMPFQIKGVDYFEAVEVIDRRKKDHHQNRLALCPVCAAKYHHAKATDNAELLKLISLESVDETTAMVKIPVTLAGENFSITFSAKHFIDLKAVLASAGEQR
jgi:hypothetical protein